MPIYTVKASDGNLYKVDAPEGTTQEQVFAFVSSQMAMRQRAPESAGFNLGDLAASFAQGAYGSTQALTDVFGAGNVASQALEERARASQAGMSVARQAELARQQERLKRAEASGSTLEEVKAALQNIAEAPLQSAAQALGSFAPYIPTMFLGPAAGVLGLGARATAAATNVAKAAPAVIGTAQGAGAVKGAIYDAVYEAERKDGVGEEEARAKAEAAQSYAGNNIDQILLGSGAGYVAGRFGAERLLTPGAAAKASQSVAGRIATAAATDVPTEAFQGGQERLAANLALQREGRDVPTFEGVAGQATQEGLLGLLGSAPVAALRGPDVEALRQEAIKKQQAEFEAEKARALAEMAARPPEPEKPIELPQGYKVMREELGREVGPESYGIFVEGQETPLTTVASEQQALQKIESFKEIRESERETLVEQMEKLNDGIQKTRDRIDYLEATGKTADPEYTKLKTALPDQELAAETKARELAEQVQQLGAPLTFAPIGQKETVREQYNVLSPTNETIGTFATAGEAEASVRGIIGDEPFKQAEMKKERDERIVALEQQLVPKLKQFGLQDVGLKVVESIENNAGGAYLNKLIRVAYDEANPLQTMRHESLHALKDLGFFTPQQWKALNERAEKQWVQELKNVPFSEGKSRHDAYVEMFTQEGEAKGLSGQQLQNYVRETLNEEAIADAFGAYDRGATPPPGMIAALFKRLKNFFLNFGQALRGAGFESADDIFQRVERGELKAVKTPVTAKKLSLPIMRGEEVPKFEGPPKEGETEPTKLKPTVDLVAKYFDDQIKDQFNGKLNYNDKQSFDRAVKTASEEVAYQLQQKKSGLDWYEDDVKDAFKQTQKYIPELKKTQDRLLFSVVAGIMSPQTNARDNWFIASKAFEHYVDTKKIPGVNPETGGLWQGGTQSANKKVQLDFLDAMVRDMGQKKALEWLFVDHTVKEINSFRSKYGNIKSGIDGKMTDMKPGLYAFGPKVGPFVANLNGIHDVTVDKWMTRTFNRYFGTMLGPDEKIVDSPTEPQRRAIKALINEVAKNAGIKPYQAQSLLWFYEQQLFTKAGVLSPSYGFSDGARKFAESRGRGGEKGVGAAAQSTSERVKGERRETTRPEQSAERPSPRGGEAAPKYSLRSDIRSYIGSNESASGTYKRRGLEGGGGVRVLGVQPVARYEPVDSLKKLVGQHGFQSPTFYELGGKNAETYQQAIQKSKDASPYGAAVYVYPVEEYANMRLFLTEDGKAGFALKGDDIVSVFSGPPHKGSANSSLQLAVQEGGRRLDAFDTVLPELYNVNGFQVVGRMKWNEDYKPDGWDKKTFLRFNNGEPDVVYMAYDPSDYRTVTENQGEYFDDPDELARVQKDAVEKYQKSTSGIVLGTKQPGAISVKGAHYGNAQVEELNASKYGTGLRGAERRRLDQTFDDRIKKRVYFYIQKEDGTTPPPESGVGQYVYTQKFDNILGPGPEMSRLFNEVRGDSNDFESSVIDAGYDGYAVPSMGMMVILNHNVPVNYVGPRSEVGAVKLSLARTNTEAFKKWFGDSTVVNEDGTPKVMYHGLAKDTTDFTRKTARGAPIFLTDDPEFAAQFATDSYESVARNPQEYLSKEQIDAGVKRAIAAIKKDYGKDSLGKEMVESLQTGDLKDATPEAREYIQKEFINLLPTGPHIMPLYVRAERPFDYQNPSHIRKVLAELTEDAYDPAEIRSGSWELIESADFQDAIQSAGFDSFYVKEQGRKNLAVYDPNQVKSATGNVGTFSRKSPDVRYSLKQVKDIFNRAEEIPMPAGVESIRDQWIGGVSGIGDRDAMYDLYRVNGSKKYIQDVQDFVRKELGDQFKGYRLMSNDELEELKTGAMGSQFASFTLNPDVARAFKNIPAYSKKSGMSVVEMDLTPEHVNMIGHPGELELVIDYGQGYNPSEIKVIEKYSLKNVAFPSAKEAQEAADAKQAPNTKEFKLFIGASRWLDEDGNPKKFFHATAGNFSEFFEGRIYLSETAKDSEKYGYGAEDRLRASIYRALNKDEKLPLFQRAVDEAVKEGKITAEDGNEFMRQVKRKIPDFGKYNAIKEEVDAELIALSPERMKIMPLYARSETPFDFRNSEHVYQVSSIVDRGDVRLSEEAIQEARRLGVPSEYPDQWYRGLPGLIKQGYPKTIESPQVQKAIRKLGFDGYIVRHNRNAPLTYVVYDNNQVKSVTGNLGDYSLETKDIRYSLRSAVGSFDPAEIQKNSETGYKSREKLINMRISDFLNLSEQGFVKSKQEAADKRVADGVPFTTIPQLMAYGDGDTLVVEGHEGRHRARALQKAGFETMPVIFKSGIRYSEQLDPVKFDYRETWPAKLQADPKAADPSFTINFPFTREESAEDYKSPRYSLPAIPKAMETRIGETTFRREPERFFERITEAISPKNFSYFRQRVLNQYNQLGVYDRKLVEQMGGKELLADQRAEAAALMSDLGAGVAASAMGFGDRNGGIPVYKNGVTTIDRSKKGLIAVLQPLARYGDPKIYQYYQYWAMVKRGVRLNAEGRETGIDNTDVQYAKYLQDKFPEFVTVQKEFIEFNNGLVKYARDTGVISEQNAEAFMRHADYVPFYRQMDGETTVGPNIFQSIAGVKPPKKLKGGTAQLADFLETAVRNTQSMIQAGVKNAAAQRAVGVVTKVKAPGMGAERLDYDANGPDVFHVLENGKRVSYRTPDVLLIDAISSLHLNEIPGLGIIAAPANALRNLVTKDPGFMMANLMRDSLSAWVTSGQKMTPIAGTVINFGKALAKKSKGYEALLDAGVIGGYEFSQNIERSGRQLEEDLSEKAGKKAPLVLRPFKSLWGALERGTEASDAATRALVYERVLNDTGNEAEALFRALEVMNFNRKGNSPLIRILTAGVPFLNARMQGLDLFYRASTGNMNMADKAAIKRQFWLRGSSMFAISAIYWMMVHDEDDYKSQEQETKDNNWIIPSLGIRIPIPFEVGVLFKTIPERIIAYSFGNDTGKDFMESMKRNFMSTFAFNPIPQVVKPVLEAAFNFNPFTWRQIVGQGMQDVAVEYQVGPGTSKIAKAIGENLGLSPMKVDHIIKGYTGTMGMYAIDTIDYIMDQFGDSPKAAKRFEQMPVIKRFAVDPAARGTVTAYYELKDSVDTTVRTMNLLERTMEPEKFAQYVQDNLGPLAVKDYIRDLERTMKELREMRIVIQSSTMSAEEKRDGLLTINQAENNLTKNIQEVKKAIASLK